MSDDMVERVAKALVHERDDAYTLTDLEGTTLAPYYRRLARAAIKAMREPTYDMLQAAALENERSHEQFPGSGGSGPSDASAEAYWQAMIDAALEERK